MTVKKITIEPYGYNLEKQCEACSWKKSKEMQKKRELSKLSLVFVKSVLCEKCLEEIRKIADKTLKK